MSDPDHLARAASRSVLEIVRARTDEALADAMADAQMADGATAYLICAGLAFLALRGEQAPDSYRLVAVDEDGDPFDIDEIAAIDPMAAGAVLGARFLTALGNGDVESAQALFASTTSRFGTIPAAIADEDEDDLRVSSFLLFLSSTARSVAGPEGVLYRQYRASQN